MTEKRTLYLGQPADDVISNIAPQTTMLSFEASGTDRQALRKCVVRTLDGMVGTVTNFPNRTIKRIVQFQISEPWQSPYPAVTSGIKPWHCDVYALYEIAPEPTPLNQGLEAAWTQMDEELKALRAESPAVVAGPKGKRGG